MDIVDGREVFADRPMYPRTFFIKSDHTFFESRLRYEVIQDILSDWEMYKRESNKVKDIVYDKKVLQLVIGEAKIQNDLEDGIKAAFASVNTYLTENIQDRNLLDTHLMNQLADEEEADILKEYILSVPRKKKETVFGIFIGYSIDYKGDKIRKTGGNRFHDYRLKYTQN